MVFIFLFKAMFVSVIFLIVIRMNGQTQFFCSRLQ